MAFVEGHDAARYQEELQYDLLPASHKFTIAKAGEGITYRDPLFSHHKTETLRRNRVIMAYWYLRAGLNPIAQAQAFIPFFWDDRRILGPAWLDVERVGNEGFTGAQVRKAAWEWCMFVKGTGRRPGIYTSPGYWNKFVETDRYSTRWVDAGIALWAAHWKNVFGWPYTGPGVVYGWNGHWDVWQYTVKFIWGDQVDLDYFNGDMRMFENFTGATIPDNDPPPPPQVLYPKLPFVEVITPAGLRIRNGPGTQYSQVGSLKYLEQIPVMGETKVGADTWLQVGYKQYCAYMYQGQQYTRFV